MLCYECYAVLCYAVLMLMLMLDEREGKERKEKEREGKETKERAWRCSGYDCVFYLLTLEGREWEVWGGGGAWQVV